MKIVLLQARPILGDMDHQLALLEEGCFSFPEADLLVTSELFLTGYPPRDLLFDPAWPDQIEAAIQAVKILSKRAPHLGVVLGTPMPLLSDNQYSEFIVARRWTNSALLIQNGECLHRQDKRLLPFYDIFDEPRYFVPGTQSLPVDFKGVKLGLSICEDAWACRYPFYQQDPVKDLVKSGAQCLINLSASPYFHDKPTLRFKVFSHIAKTFSVPVICVNQVGGQDELLFDGSSMSIDFEGNRIECLPAFDSFSKQVEVTMPPSSHQTSSFPFSYPSSGLTLSERQLETTLKGISTGIRDFVHAAGRQQVVLGLSGGIDSALVAVLAVEALGKENVSGVLMPSPYSSAGSLTDAWQLATTLGITAVELPIETPWQSTMALVHEHWSNHFGVTEENLQSRIRGLLVMAVANKTGALMLTTGNKSELSVGYCTLYGDMNGALAPIGDLYKTQVYDCARWINRSSEIIPYATIQKPPSAELRPDQTDQDSLPPYSVLDALLYRLIDKEMKINTILEEGFEEDTVDWVVKQIRQTEFKRWQAPPILRVSEKAFGMGRRIPLSKKS